jgi:hypothetical protein
MLLLQKSPQNRRKIAAKNRCICSKNSQKRISLQYLRRFFFQMWKIYPKVKNKSPIYHE